MCAGSGCRARHSLSRDRRCHLRLGGGTAVGASQPLALRAPLGLTCHEDDASRARLASVSATLTVLLCLVSLPRSHSR